MRTLIFRTVAPYLSSLMVLYSVFVLLRGHNEPGGGFIGGLIAASDSPSTALHVAFRLCAAPFGFTPWRLPVSACLSQHLPA